MTRGQKTVLIRIITASVLTVLLLILIPQEGAACPLGLIPNGLFTGLLYAIPYIVIGYDILAEAVENIFKGEVLDEEFLMAVATVGAFAIGEFSEGVAVLVFFRIGELFEDYAVDRSRDSITALMDIRPDHANLVMTDSTGITGSLSDVHDGADAAAAVRKVAPGDVPVGSIIVVYPGEKIPIDGVIESGSGAVNTSALTGESMPVTVNAGDAVISGSIALNCELRVRTTREFGESTVSKILELVENAASRKASAENFISRFARRYTPAVCGAALAVAVIPPVFAMFRGIDAEWSRWIYNGLAFLVTSCPCALVISIPLTFFAGIGGAGRSGILIKGSNYLELLSKVRTVAFDKTGTVTEGVFEVDAVHHSEMEDRALLELAALAEAHSSHPIAESIVRAAEELFESGQAGGPSDGAAEAGPASGRNGREFDLRAEAQKRVTGLSETGGEGIEADVSVAGLMCEQYLPKKKPAGEAVRLAVGSEALMRRLDVECIECHSSGTIVHVAIDGSYAGHIVISDVVKPEAPEAVAGLKEAGVRRTVMLTGDRRAVAEDVASRLGIDEVHSGLMPSDKVAEVERLLGPEEGRGCLAFVGDGINDAPVLARADVGIAMGALGSDAAIEAADVVLMDDDPRKIALGIRLARRTLKIVYENIVFAIGVKSACLILIPLGIFGMEAAIFADVGVMVLAVLNAMRAIRPIPQHVNKNQF